MFDIVVIGQFLRKTFKRNDLLIIGGLIFAFFLTRIINLDKFPIFSDEGIYIHWAKVAWHDATWRFISLTDGKQPLQTWGTIPFLKLFHNNLLFGGRMFAVATGFAAMAGMFTLLYYLWGKKTAVIGTVLYVFTPYFLFYDRMALVDSGVNAGFIWILFLSIILAKSRRLDSALIFGLVGGIALLAKSSVRIFVGLSAFAFIFFFDRTKKFWYKLVNFGILYLIGAASAVAIYNVQRLSPFFQYVSQKNNTFVMSLAEFKATPFMYFPSNIHIAPEYVFSELAYVVGIFGLIGLFMLFKKDKQLFLYFAIWILVPYIIVAFLSKVIFPRYLIFFASTLVILAAYLIGLQKNIKKMVLLLLLFFISVGYFDYTLIADFKNIPFPEVDRGQYLEAWPAGWGIKEIMDYARVQSTEKPVIMIAEGNFGMTGDVLDVHRKDGDQIDIRGYWPLEEKNLIENQKELDTKKVYVVISHKSRLDEIPSNWPIKLVKQYDKPGNKSAIFLFELTR